MKRKGFLGGIFAMALILVLTLVLSVGSVSAAEPTIVDSGNCGANGDNITWTLDDAGTLTISGEGEMAEYTYTNDSLSKKYITSAPWGNRVKSVSIQDGVTSIGSWAFLRCTDMTSVTIPDSVTSIGNSAFSSCAGLTSVTIPNNVTSIGTAAFDECTGLKTVTIPDSVTIIKNGTFAHCTGLTSVTIGSNVTSIGQSAFLNCTGLASVTIGSNVTSIGDYAFSYCTGLTSVTIPDSVTSIGDRAFYNCTGLTSVTIPDSVTSIGDEAFYGCTGLTSVTIGSNVTSIGDYAFHGCTGLTSVTIPDSVISIGNYAFNGCTGLTSVTIGNSVTSIGDRAFYNCTGLTEIIYNAKAAADLQDDSIAFCGAGTSSGGFRVVIGDGVEKIPAYLFDFCKGLTNIVIPDSVTRIGDDAFFACHNIEKVHITDIAVWCGIVFGNYTSNPLHYTKNLYVNDVLVTNLTIPSSVTSIGDYAFAGCMGLTSVTIPDNVTSIGDYAFAGCTGLTSVTIPDNVTSIGDYAFNGCTGLKEVIYNARAVADLTYDSSVFENAGTATDGMKVVFGESVEKIPGNIFSNCESLTSVTIGSNVTSIGEKAFYNCKGLVEISYNARAAECSDYFAFNNAGTAARGLKVIFGESVEKIPDGLFDDCTALTGVTIGSNVTSIGDYAFSDCAGLTSVTIPDSVTSIGYYAFYNCTGLTSVTIGSSVTSIGDYAFSDCTGLTSVTIPNSVTSIGGWAFSGCTGLTSVTIGSNVTSIGDYAFSGCTDLKEVIYNAKAAADLTYNPNIFENAGTAADGMKVVFGESVKKIPAYLLYGAGNIRFFVFTGNPPTVGSSAFSDNYAYALYPVHNSEWTKSVREACGSHLTWIGYCTEPVSSAACRIDQTAYLPNDTLNTQGLCMTLTHKDGCTMTIPYDSGLLELGSCDMSTPGAKTIDVTYRGTTAQLKIYVHERKTQTLDKKGYPESSHNYENNLDKTYTYKAAGAVSLDVTFSAQTEVETNIDYLYVNGAQYTGTELAGKTISIQGDTLTIRLVSDKGDSAYGFSIDRIAKTYMEHQYKNGVCTLCGAKDPNFKLAAPTVKPSYVGASGKPYLRWNAVADASQYEVYRATTKNGTYTLLGTTTATNYTDNKAGSGYTYFYKVKALAANGAESDYSAVVAGICHCAKPTVKATYMGASGKPYIKWNAVANASQYEVYRATTKSGTYTLLGTTTATNYTDNKAGSGYTYYYKVKALAANGAESDYSAVVAGICHCAKPTVKATYMGATGKPYIRWNAVANVSKYEVYRATSKNGTYTLLGTTTDTNYTDNKAGSGYTYYYKVRAISKVKSSANSVFSTPVAGICHCAKPTVKATYMGTTGKPYIKWNAVANASKYEVYRATSKDGTYTLLGTTTATNYTDNKAGTGYTYYYKVKAISKVKSSANSVFSTPVAGICHCAKPTVKVAATSAGKPRLTWNAVAGASKYYIYRSTEANGTFEYLYTTSNLFYTNSSAKAGTTYYYKVKAVSKVKSSANSVFSTAVSITVK